MPSLNTVDVPPSYQYTYAFRAPPIVLGAGAEVGVIPHHLSRRHGAAEKKVGLSIAVRCLFLSYYHDPFRRRKKLSPNMRRALVVRAGEKKVNSVSIFVIPSCPHMCHSLPLFTLELPLLLLLCVAKGMSEFTPATSSCAAPCLVQLLEVAIAEVARLGRNYTASFQDRDEDDRDEL